MAEPKRELILTALFAILEGVQTANPTLVKSVIRNRAPIITDKRPALVLLDGDERYRTSRDRMNGYGAQRPGPQIMQMQPQIVIVLDEPKPSDSLKGTALNTLRSIIMTAVAESGELREALGGNGSTVFNGSTTDLKTGGAISGQLLLDYSFFYALLV